MGREAPSVPAPYGERPLPLSGAALLSLLSRVVFGLLLVGEHTPTLMVCLGWEVGGVGFRYSSGPPRWSVAAGAAVCQRHFHNRVCGRRLR